MPHARTQRRDRDHVAQERDRLDVEGERRSERAARAAQHAAEHHALAGGPRDVEEHEDRAARAVHHRDGGRESDAARPGCGRRGYR